MDSDFVSKVSKFEYMAHSTSPPSPVSPKWFVTDGIHNPSPLWDSLKLREQELFLQHRKAIEDRLKEEDQNRQDKQRLDEILSLFSEFEREHCEPAQQTNTNESQQLITNRALGSSKEAPLDDYEKQNHISSDVPDSASQSLPQSAKGSRSTSVYPNRIKTNGSLPHERWTLGENGGYSNRMLESNSSDDELSDKSPSESNGTNLPNEHIFKNASFLNCPHSPRTRIKTVATIAVPDVQECALKPLDKTKFSNNPEYYIIRIAQLQKELSEAEQLFNESLQQIKVEYALVRGEEKEELNHYEEEKLRLMLLKQKENKLLEELEHAKFEELGRLEKAKIQVKSVEQRFQNGGLKITLNGEEDNEHGSLEELETSRKEYEDLEFQFLEHQAHAEEKREEVMQQIEQLQESVFQRDSRLKELTESMKNLKQQIILENRQYREQHYALMLMLEQVQENFKALSSSPASSDSLSLSDANTSKQTAIQEPDSDCSSLTSGQELESLTDESNPPSLLHNSENWGDTSHVKRRDKLPSLRPLTRYLPSRSSDLNLRQHIEAGGHPIETCPQVRLTDTLCQGFLSKMGGRWGARWHKRWFVFDRSRRVLAYYRDKTKTKPRGVIDFQAIVEVYVDHCSTAATKGPNPRATFCVKTYDRLYYLVAANPEVMCVWVDVIFTGAEGYLDFLEDFEP